MQFMYKIRHTSLFLFTTIKINYNDSTINDTITYVVLLRDEKSLLKYSMTLKGNKRKYILLFCCDDGFKTTANSS